MDSGESGEYAMNHIESLEKGEEIKWPVLGISMTNVTDTANLYRNGINVDKNITEGVVVVKAESGSAAAEAGADNNNNVVDKTAWFTPPEGIEKWAPTKAGYYHFDVLQMHMLRDNYEMRKITGERSFNQNADNYWFDRQVTVHGAYPMYLPCANTFGVELERNEEGKWFPKAKDSICKYIHENYPAVTPRQVNTTYSIMLLRLHNIGEDGNTTYKYVFYVDKVFIGLVTTNLLLIVTGTLMYLK